MYRDILKNKFGTIKVKEGETKRKPYVHQKEAMNKLSKAVLEIDDYKGLLVIPTGGGKTLTAVQWILKNVLNNGSKVLWIAHRHELLDQALKTFIDNSYENLMSKKKSYNYRVLSGKHDRSCNISSSDDLIIASKDSLRAGLDYLVKNWVKKTKEEIFIVIDEAHHSTAKGYKKIIKDVEENAKGKVKLLGLTATPFRTADSEKGALKRVYKDDITYSIDLRTLINKDILAKPLTSEMKSNVEVAIDLNEDELRNIRNKDNLPDSIINQIIKNKDRNRMIVEHYIKNKEKYGKTLVFAINQNHAIELKSVFEKHGVKADFIISGIETDFTKVSISNEEKERIIKDFKDGDLEVLVNVNMLTEGTDIPNVHTVFLARPTTSAILMTQMIGRALRGKAAGGTEEAYIVSFVDDWKNKISWVSPNELIEDMYSEDESLVERSKRVVERISIKAIEDFAKYIDESVDESKFTNISFIDRIPVGLYSFEITVKLDNDDEDKRICDILVYDCFSEKLEQFIEDLDEIFEELSLSEEDDLSEKEIDKVLKIAKENYLSKCDTSIACKENDIKDIILYYGQTGEKPVLVPFENREKFDVSKIAEEIFNKDLGVKAKRELINKYWNDEGNYLKLFYNGNHKLFVSLIDDCLYALEEEDESDNSSLTMKEEEDNLDYSRYDEKEYREHMSLVELEKCDPEYYEKLRNEVFKKYSYGDGLYKSATGLYIGSKKSEFEIDHKIPMSKGGLTNLENLQLLSRGENRRKGNKSWDEFLEKEKKLRSEKITESQKDEIKNLIIENPKEAIKICESLLKNTNDNKILLYLAEAYLEKGEYKKTIETAKNGLKEFSDLSKYTNENVYGNNVIGSAYFSLGELDKAIVYFKKTLRLEKYNVYALENLGDIYWDKEEYAEARKYYEIIAFNEEEDNETRALIFGKIGMLALNCLDKPRIALNSFRKGIELDYTYYYNYVGLAEYYISQKLFEKAKEELNAYFEIGEKNVDTLITLSKIYKGLKDYKKIEETLLEAKNLEPENPKALQYLALEMERKRRYESAVEYYKKALDIEGDNDIFWNDLGVVYEKNKEYLKAKKCYEKALELYAWDLYENNLKIINKKINKSIK
ncbi:DEAD/DEAH box helicase family protein [Clostridium perfringens]|nr:DEAD/DEAH box helicase family protein [Clostridium perfringens]